MEDMNNTINPDQPVIQPTETPPIQPTKTPITPETNTKPNLFKYLFIICFILLLVSVIFSVLTIKYFNSKLEPIEPNITEVIPTSIPTEEANEVTSADSSMEDWKTYTDKEVGFSFNYPPQLNFTDPKIADGNNILTIYSIIKSPLNTEPFVSSVNIGITLAGGGGRGGCFADAAPYIKSGNNITNGYHYNVDPRNIRKIYTNPNGVEIVVINDTSKFSEGGEDEPDYNNFTKYGNTGALINTKNKIYPGLTLEVNSVIKEADFFIILDTIKLN